MSEASDRIRELLALPQKPVEQTRKNPPPVAVGYNAASGQLQYQGGNGAISEGRLKTSGAAGLGDPVLGLGGVAIAKPHVKRVSSDRRVYLNPTGFIKIGLIADSYISSNNAYRPLLGGDRDIPVDLFTLSGTSFPEPGSFPFFSFAKLTSTGREPDQWIAEGIRNGNNDVNGSFEAVLGFSSQGALYEIPKSAFYLADFFAIYYSPLFYGHQVCIFEPWRHISPLDPGLNGSRVFRQDVSIRSDGDLSIYYAPNVLAPFQAELSFNGLAYVFPVEVGNYIFLAADKINNDVSAGEVFLELNGSSWRSEIAIFENGSAKPLEFTIVNDTDLPTREVEILLLQGDWDNPGSDYTLSNSQSSLDLDYEKRTLIIGNISKLTELDWPEFYYRDGGFFYYIVCEFGFGDTRLPTTATVYKEPIISFGLPSEAPYLDQEIPYPKRNSVSISFG